MFISFGRFKKVTITIFIFFGIFYYIPTSFSDTGDTDKNTQRISTDRHEYLAQEAQELFNQKQYGEVIKKLDEYIDKVFFVKDCESLKIYSDSLLGLGNEVASEEYIKYYNVCKDTLSQEDLKDFMSSINNPEIYEDKNLHLRKKVLNVFYENELIDSNKFEDTDNYLFITMLYVAGNHSKSELLGKDVKQRILESDHITKPTLLYFYIEHLYATGEDISEERSMIEEILKYEDRYIAGDHYNSAHVYAYKRLGDIETDSIKKLRYRSITNNLSDTFTQNSQFISDRLQDLETTVIDIISNDTELLKPKEIPKDIVLPEHVSSILNIFSSSTYSLEDIYKLQDIVNKSGMKKRVSNEDYQRIFQSYIDELTRDGDIECKQIKEMLGDITELTCINSISSQVNDQIDNSIIPNTTLTFSSGDITKNNKKYIALLLLTLLIITFGIAFVKKQK